ncbi:lytic transglycosylase domain-containing protein [Bdellovibrio sp. HCB337]|uniref:lytic transglycosylase domain-containing protein n=1 Tax=Bdellovibrio sp. HCB337 TaxID=3394358 RepID=UPI0039A69D3F
MLLQEIRIENTICADLDPQMFDPKSQYISDFAPKRGRNRLILVLEKDPESADMLVMTTMKKRIGLFFILAGWGVLLLLFQNMTLVEFSTLNLPVVDEDARQDQARELLGGLYKGSFAQKFEGEQYLNYLVYKKIEGSMSAEWKRYIPEITQTLISESQKYELDPIFVLAVIQTESNFNTRAKGTSGEIGLMQILPKTGEWIAKKYKMPWNGDNSLYDPLTNIRIGVVYFAHLRNEFESRAYQYLPAYNMGPSNMRKVTRTIGSVSPDGKVMKREYAMRVMKNYTNIYEQMMVKQRELIRYAQTEDGVKLSR